MTAARRPDRCASFSDGPIPLRCRLDRGHQERHESAYEVKEGKTEW